MKNISPSNFLLSALGLGLGVVCLKYRLSFLDTLLVLSTAILLILVLTRGHKLAVLLLGGFWFLGALRMNQTQALMTAVQPRTLSHTVVNVVEAPRIHAGRQEVVVAETPSAAMSSRSPSIAMPWLQSGK